MASRCAPLDAISCTVFWMKPTPTGKCVQRAAPREAGVYQSDERALLDLRFIRSPPDHSGRFWVLFSRDRQLLSGGLRSDVQHDVGQSEVFSVGRREITALTLNCRTLRGKSHISKYLVWIIKRRYSFSDAREGTDHMLVRTLGNKGTKCIQVCVATSFVLCSRSKYV